MSNKLLTIYLKDHHAAAVAASEVAKRCLANNPTGTLATDLRRLLSDLEDERTTIERILRMLDSGPDRLKGAAAWLADKVGRVKLNGRLLGYSDLSRLEEIEGLRLLVEFQSSLWRSLEELDDPLFEGYDFGMLVRRAEGHLRTLEAHRLAAAGRAIGAVRHSNQG